MSHRSTLGLLNQPSYHSHSMTQSSSHSPMGKAPPPQRAASQDSVGDSVRKRVCKACDRCRLKKSKCDGSHPCTRCKQDNAICVFGERKKSHDKVYPKGYVEMLEQQQSQLVSGLQEMYKRLVAADAWTGAPLSEANGHPLTHDILARLDLLENKADGTEPDMFEEDCEKLQARLIAEGAPLSHPRRGSFSSESEHSQHSHARSQSHGTPTISRPTPMFKQDFTFQSAPSSPPRLQGSPAPLQQSQSFPAGQPSPLQHNSPLGSDPQRYQNDWATTEQESKFAMQSDFAMQTPELDQSLGSLGSMSNFGQWQQATMAPYDLGLTLTSYPHMLSGFGSVPRLQDGMLNPYSMEGMMDDPENNYINFQQMQAA